MADLEEASRIPNAIRDKREAHGHLSQAGLAAMVGITPQDMNKIERGTKLPTRGQAKRIARVLRCKVEDLYSGSFLLAILNAEKKDAS